MISHTFVCFCLEFFNVFNVWIVKLIYLSKKNTPICQHCNILRPQQQGPYTNCNSSKNVAKQMSGTLCITNLHTFLSQPRCKTNKYTMPILFGIAHCCTCSYCLSTDKWKDAISTILIHFQIHVLFIFVWDVQSSLWSWTKELVLNRKLWIYIISEKEIGNFYSIWFSSWNFRFINGLLFRNSTVSGFSGTLKYPYQLSLFQKFWKFWLNGKYPCTVV